jgi:hypothetical protein
VDLHRISMHPGEARRAYREYRRSMRRWGDPENEQIVRGYQALARGRQLISLRAAMRTAGLDEAGLPRVAVCRADARWCFTEGVQLDGGVIFRMDRVSPDRDASRRVRLPPGTFRRPERFAWQTHRAMVPIVPAPLRPSRSLSRFHVLWDVEWRPVPPEDPALLQHVGGDLYAVFAVWNLTDLERAVLSERMMSEREGN